MTNRYADAPGTHTFGPEVVPDALYELWAPWLSWPLPRPRFGEPGEPEPEQRTVEQPRHRVPW